MVLVTNSGSGRNWGGVLRGEGKLRTSIKEGLGASSSGSLPRAAPQELNPELLETEQDVGPLEARKLGGWGTKQWLRLGGRPQQQRITPRPAPSPFRSTACWGWPLPSEGMPASPSPPSLINGVREQEPRDMLTGGGEGMTTVPLTKAPLDWMDHSIT